MCPIHYSTEYVLVMYCLYYDSTEERTPKTLTTGMTVMFGLLKFKTSLKLLKLCLK